MLKVISVEILGTPLYIFFCFLMSVYTKYIKIFDVDKEEETVLIVQAVDSINDLPYTSGSIKVIHFNL